MVKEILGVERAIAQELVSRPGKPVCAEARGDVDLCARRDALLRRVGVLEHLEFSDGVDRGVHGQAVGKRLHQRDPVEREIVALRALSINREAQAESRRVELLGGAVRIGRQGAGGQQRQLGELAAVQGKLGHAPVVNFVGDGRRGGLHHGQTSGPCVDNNEFLGADLKRNVHSRYLADLNRQAL